MARQSIKWWKCNGDVIVEYKDKVKGEVGPTGWPRGMHTCLRAVWPGFESQPSYKLSYWWFINVFAVPRMNVKTGIMSASIRWWMLKDPMVSFTKSRRAIARTLNKFKIPALTSRGHCISGTAMPSANDATLQHYAAYKWMRRRMRNLARKPGVWRMSGRRTEAFIGLVWVNIRKGNNTNE